MGAEASAPFAQPGSFLLPSAAFVPTGKQPDWSTPQQGRTSSPAPLPAYPPMPAPQLLPRQLQNGDTVLQYSRGGTAGGLQDAL